MHPHADCLVDDGGGYAGSPVQGQPTAEHVVPPGSQAVTGTDQPRDGLGVQRGRVLGLVRCVHQAQGRDPYRAQPSDHERDSGEVQHTAADVRRTGAERPQVARAGAERAGHLGGVLVDDPDAPSANVEIHRVLAAVDDSDRSRGRCEQPVADPGWRADGDHVTDASPSVETLVCTKGIGLTTVADRRGVPPASGAGVAV